MIYFLINQTTELDRCTFYDVNYLLKNSHITPELSHIAICKSIGLSTEFLGMFECFGLCPMLTHVVLFLLILL